MKIAIVHDYIKEYGGAERVLEALHKIFPDAPIFTTVYLPSYLGPHKTRFEEMDIKTSFLQFIPLKAKLISPFRLISPLVFKSFDFSDFDVIIVSQTGAYFPNTIARGPASAKASAGKPVLRKPFVITYTHTPPRYLYGYQTARDWRKNKIIYLATLFMNHFLRMVDFKSAQNVDKFIANSEEVKSRIEKFYRRDAVVVYPPVETRNKNYESPARQSLTLKASAGGRIKNKKEEYYLAGGRLARAKGIDVIVKAFNENGLPLKIFGKGFAGYGRKIKDKILNIKNIEYLGEIADEQKLKLMASAKAYIFASYDEDFGITPVEAMSVGTPIIAYRSGGVKETVVDGVTGIFFDENTPESLNRAISKFESLKISSNDCVARAEKFSEEEFDRKIKLVITEVQRSSQKH